MKKKIRMSYVYMLWCLAGWACGMTSCDKVEVIAPKNELKPTMLKIIRVEAPVTEEGVDEDGDTYEYYKIGVVIKTDSYAKVFYQCYKEFDLDDLSDFEEGEEQYSDRDFPISSQVADANGDLTIWVVIPEDKIDVYCNLWALAEGKAYSQNLIPHLKIT